MLSRETNIDLSLTYHLEEELKTEGWGNIKKVEERPKKGAELPSTAFSWESSTRSQAEIGTDTHKVDNLYSIYVYARNRRERRDICAVLCKILKGTIELIDFNLGFWIDENGSPNPYFDAEAQKIGTLIARDISERPLSGGNVSPIDKWRADVSFTITNYI